MTDSPLTLVAPARAEAPTGPPVTVVVVTRGVTRYLGETLTALAAQTRIPAHVVVVDALRRSSAVPDDDVARLAARTLALLGTHLRIVDAPGARTFGHAVRSALEQTATGAGGDGPSAGPTAGSTAAPTGWLWLLHDDSAPEPAALDELVRAVEHSPSVAVAGVKQRSWTDPARLLELGVTTSRLGRRMTGIEVGEVDQGQHDGRDDVLGVGLAGALVRREVWDALGGTDPRLGPFGDGLDLSRRARLAGHRVVVVPSAAVRHAQASYNGLRDEPTGPEADSEAETLPAAPHAEPDPRRSFGARRRAYVHARLAAVPVLLLPFLGIGYLLAGAFRAVVRLLTKDPVLALAEISAPVAALLHPGRMARARGITRRAEVASRRSLRPLQNTWRDVAREQRDGHLARVELRRVGWAPSELELSELAALASKRRFTLAALGVALVGLTAAVLGGLVGGVVGGGSLVGGALLPAQESLGELWRAATSGWVAGGLGTAGPADAFLVALLPFTALTGAAAVGAVDLLFLGGLVLAGLGAWFAAGAATRSVGVRLWAAIVWVAAPSLTLALDGGRVGAVVAHVALPWVALGIARALGVQRQDVVLSGLVGARRVSEEADGAPGASAPPIARGAHAGRSSAFSASLDAAASSPVTASAEESPTPMVASVPTPSSSRSSSSPSPSSARTAQGEADAAARTTSLIAPATGSIGAAAAAGLAFALAVAGAPVLLPFGLIALLAVAAAAPRRRRGRLALVALPALAVAGPSIAQALNLADSGGWRLLLADPGVPQASSAAPVWQQLLAWPVSPPTAVLDRLPESIAAVTPFVLGGVVALLALLALLRGATVARGVRAGWLVAACGLAAAIASGRVETAAGVDVVVRGWTGPGISLVLLGLLTAAVLGTGGLNDRMAGFAFGWRQIGAVVLTAVAVLAPAVPLAEWTVRARTTDVGAPGALEVVSRDGFVVPAVGQQSQTSADRSRVLALAVDPAGGVDHQLLRGDGPLLTETATAVDARVLSGAPGSPVLAPADPADEIVTDLVARLSAAAAGNVSAELGDLAVAAVLVPPATSADVEAARSVLVGRLDATAGLERITENSTGVIWRVVVAADDPAGTAGAAWARVVEPGVDGAVATTAPLEALPLAVDTRVAAGDVGRQVVLAERADAGWHAWLDGRPLRSVTGDWRQTFALGADGGRLTVGYSAPDRTPWLVLQGAVLLFTVVVAVPGRRRRGGVR